MAGLFFCLASAEDAGLFLSSCNTATYKRLQQIFCYQCNYTAQTSKAFTGLYRGISVDSTHSSAHNTAATQADYTPPAPRWSAHTRPDAMHRYQIPTPHRTLYSSAQPPYYNKVYIGVQRRTPVMDLCQTVQRIPQTMPARRGQRLHLYRVSPALSTRRGSPAAGGAEPLAALAAALFGLSPDSQ